MDPNLVGRIREKLRTVKLSFELFGAIIFGSYAAGKATVESDLDLLVVGHGLPQKRHHRAQQIGELKRTLPELSLDVSLMTPDETYCNFANHNPLFLDIAEDGILLLDHDGSLARVIEETRLYIRTHGIIRIEGGWRFPVRTGVPTYLSKVSFP